ncbi:MAG: cytochrome C oxidase subunit IV family protein [Acidimicrobiales bacterium]
MSTATAAVEDAHPEPVEPGEDHHPSDAHYVRVAVALAVITGAEVALTYLGVPAWAEVTGLLVMMAIKFFVVAAQFMHLKFDSKVLSRLFYAGLFLAVGVYLAALFTFRVFS